MDKVNHPPHYLSLDTQCTACKKPIECIDITRHLSFNLGNAIKYIWRCDYKDAPIEDLKKALWYLNDEINKRAIQSLYDEIHKRDTRRKLISRDRKGYLGHQSGRVWGVSLARKSALSTINNLTVFIYAPITSDGVLFAVRSPIGNGTLSGIIGTGHRVGMGI